MDIIVALFRKDGTATVYDVHSVGTNGPSVQFNIEEEPGLIDKIQKGENPE